MSTKVRVLYDFQAEPGSSEMSVTTGEVLTVTNTNVGEGWWEGVKANGQKGLFPAAYVEKIVPDLPPPPAIAPGQRYDQPADDWGDQQDWDDDDWDDDNETYSEIGPGATQSVAHSAPAGTGYNASLPPPPPSDGDNFSVSSSNVAMPVRRPPKIFSKSGDAYILGTTTVTVPEQEKIYIYQDNQYYFWKQRDPYTVVIASPKTESKLGGFKTFTAYQVSTSFSGVTVARRYKQFDWLHERLVEKFSLIPIPPLPAKQQAGRFEEQFIEHRRLQLQEFANYICKHPVLSSCEVWMHFLTCTDPKKWKAGKRAAEKDPLVGATYCAAVIAPEKQLLQSLVDQQVEFCGNFTNQMGRAVKSIMNIADDQVKKYQIQCKKDYQRIGEGFSELARSLEIDERRMTTGVTLSQSVGQAAGIFISIGQMYADQPKRDWLPLSDRFHIYRGVLDSFPDILSEHRNAMQKRKECEKLTAEQKMGNVQMQEVNRRTDVMSYALMAELNQFRIERDVQLKETMRDFITAQIDFYKSIVQRLEQAKTYFEQ